LLVEEGVDDALEGIEGSSGHPQVPRHRRGQLLDEAGDDGVAPDDLAKKGARRTAA
jgi:hypothetical protein